MVYFISFLLPHLLASFAPDFIVQTEIENEKLKVIATPPRGHHFNVDAPMFLSLKGSSPKMRPTQAQKEKVLFDFILKDPQDATLSLYLCDNKNTYCEKHDVSVQWVMKDGQNQYVVSNSKKLLNPKDSQNHLDASHLNKTGKDKNGFILNDPKQAFERAKLENKPVFIDFFGIWCPPCNELDQDVFPSKEFQTISEKFVKLKMDVDLASTWKLASQYKVNNFPTLIIATHEGDEVYRILGSLPKRALIQELEKAISQVTESFESLKKRAETGGLSSADHLGKIYFDRGDFDQAEKLLQKSKKYKEFYYISHAKNLRKKLDTKESSEIESALEKEYAEWIEQAVSLFPKNWRVAYALQVELANYYKEKKQFEQWKTTLKNIVQSCRYMLKFSKEVENTGFYAGTIWMILADTYEELGNGEDSKNAWVMAMKDFKSRSKSFKDKMNQVYYAYCLAKLGKKEESDFVFQKLQRNYPNDFTFYYEQADTYYDLKNYQGAIELAKKALNYTYGTNTLKVTYLLAKAYKDSGKVKEALQLVEDTLKNVQAPDDPNLSTAKYIKRLKDLTKNL